MIPFIIAGAIGYGIAKLLEEDKTPKYADGGSVLLAPNGKPSNLTPEQYKLVRTSEFKAWFGDWQNDPETASKVVDDNGEPMVVYHGTNTEFYKFDKSKGKGSIKQKSINFSSKKEVSKDYGSRILECFLNIRNPYIKNYNGDSYWNIEFNARYEKKFDEIPDQIVNKSFDEKIYDGVIFINIKDSKSRYSQNVLVGNNYYAFKNNQIKLADGTNTTFDVNNSDIRFNDGGLTNYTEFWNNLVIEDGSKYIGRKFGDVFPFLKGGFSTPFKYKLKVKQYNNYLKRLSEDNYTTKSKRQADLNKIERNKKYIYKVKYLSEFYIDNTGTIIDFKHNNDILFDEGGSVSYYTKYWDNVVIEDGSKYIGRKFADVFPFIGKQTSPAEIRISVKEYNKLLSRLENDNYTTKGMKTADLNRFKKIEPIIEKLKYIARFYLDPSGRIIGFDNSYI
jgi:hypothetical protein